MIVNGLKILAKPGNRSKNVHCRKSEDSISRSIFLRVKQLADMPEANQGEAPKYWNCRLTLPVKPPRKD